MRTTKERISALQAENDQLKGLLREQADSASILLNLPVHGVQTLSQEECVERCKVYNRIRVSICAIEFEFHKDLKKQQACLQRQRKWYDGCLKQCREK